MAAKKGDDQPIIIKKRKKGGHGPHHGGAWKVAYADFVTAMMAFFLLMWLLAATTEEQRQGIADYFSTVTISNSTSGGGGMLAGQTLSREGALVDERAPIGLALDIPVPSDSSRVQGEEQDEADKDDEAARQREVEDARFEAAAEALFQAIRERPDLSELESHLLVDQTPEGLRIQIVDQAGVSMFDSGSAVPRARTRQLLRMISEAIAHLPNDISITGHTDAVPYRGGNGYDNWELSADRANASRRAIIDAGLDPARIHRVAGRADRDLLLPEDPANARNRRISIVLLREEPLTGEPPDEDTETRTAAPSASDEEPEGSVGPSILDRDT